MGKPIKFDEAAKQAALRTFELTGNRQSAVDAAGVNIKCLDYHLKRDPEFKERWFAARARYVGLLEAEALRRAVEGWDEQKCSGGTVYNVRKYSDALLLHLLKKKAPKEHGDRVKVEQKTTVHSEIGLKDLSPESRAMLRKILEQENGETQ